MSALRRAVFASFVPNKIVLHRPPGAAPIVKIAPYTEPQNVRGGKATAQVVDGKAPQAGDGFDGLSEWFQLHEL